MIQRDALSRVRQLIDEYPAVGLLGPRQVGKTTLALEVANQWESLYLDLESVIDRAKLANAETFLAEHAGKLVILDEAQRLPELFQSLRGLIDANRRKGLRTGQFLILGSASIDLLQQSSESLAGRIAYTELTGVTAREVEPPALKPLWLRGGFPDSLLARTDDQSHRWRLNFIRTYLERDIPQLGPRIAAETLQRFWTMLAHHQGGLLNAAQLARNLGVDGKTVANYLDLMADLLLVRRLPPWHANVGKRLVKSPKVYVRDSGLVHALLGIRSREELLGHPVVGGSWEGFVVESLLAQLPDSAAAHFYRTAAGAEVDLVLSLSAKERWFIEIKHAEAPKLTRGFHEACRDLNPTRRFVVYPGQDRFPLTAETEAISLPELCQLLAKLELGN